MTTDERLSEATVLGYLRTLSNWGRWGDRDERGTLNLITPECSRAAARLVTEGVSVSCSRELTTTAHPGEFVGPPQRFMVLTGEGLGDRHRVSHRPPGREHETARVHGASEYLGMVFHGHTVTHVDALSHVFFDGRMYNDRPPELVNSVSGASSHAVTAARDGIVSRGVLLDLPAALGVDWLDAGVGVGPDEIAAAERRQGVRVRAGDAVLLRTGYGRRLAEVGPLDPRADGHPGWHAACLPWLRERDVAVIGADTGNDVTPSGYPELALPVHVVGIVAMGLWLVDNMDLEELASTAQRLRRWEFQFVVAPLRLAGGTGSPVNPIAVF